MDNLVIKLFLALRPIRQLTPAANSLVSALQLRAAQA